LLLVETSSSDVRMPIDRHSGEERESVPGDSHRSSLGSRYRGQTDAGLLACREAHLVFASRGYPSGRLARPSRPDRASIYRVIWMPAVAEIVGEGRPWTVLMISLLSMPCR
jgi:hypothetical protein